MSNQAPFPINREMSQVSIAYRNRSLIADDVLPRVPVGKREFGYRKHALADGFTLPDTKVGRRSRPSEVSFAATEETAQVSDYGLDDPIPQDDIDNADPGHDPKMRSTEQLTDLILLDREKRVADLVFGASNYGSNTLTLSGSDQFDDDASDPIDTLMTALDAMVMRGNIAVIGQQVWSKLCRHPKLVSAALRNSGKDGVARQQDLADLLGLDAVFVGAALLNTAKRGQTASLSRVWGKHVALLYRDRLADARSGVTFGFTAQYKTRVSGANPDPNIGLRGGLRVRVGESVKELVTAADLGYLIRNAVE